MLDADVFYSKVIHTECKQHGSPVVRPKTGGDSALLISVFNKAFLKELMRNDASLQKTVHTFLYAYVDISIGCC